MAGTDSPRKSANYSSTARNHDGNLVVVGGGGSNGEGSSTSVVSSSSGGGGGGGGTKSNKRSRKSVGSSNEKTSSKAAANDVVEGNANRSGDSSTDLDVTGSPIGKTEGGIEQHGNGVPSNRMHHGVEPSAASTSSSTSDAEDAGSTVASTDLTAAATTPADTSGDLSITSQNTPLSLSATLSRGPYHQCGTARRVKVYELKGETWFDRGTGYCAGVYDEQNDAALLVTRMEETCRRLTLGVGDELMAPTIGPSQKEDEEQSNAEGREDREHYVLVVSENLDSDDLLLKARVVKDDVYQRQQDTLVVWTEPDGTDMALSFQEADGCHEVWEFLTEVQKHFLLSARGGVEEGLDMDDGEAMTSGMLGMSAAGMTTENDLVMSDGSPFALPDPRLDNLHIIDVTLKDAGSRTPQAREKVAEWILREEYILKLVPAFHDAEELEQLDALHRLCAIMHTIIMLNDNVLVERLLRDDVFLGVVGMLEYDPEFPHLKASYREYLTGTARFRQVVQIPDDAILAKIHQTFRLQYLKDVILARTLDDSTFAVLNSLIFYHQADIVVFCTSSESLLSSLFQLFEPERKESDEKKAEAIIFLQQLCAVGKQVQLPSRLALYRTLTEWGLLIVLEYALTRPEARLRNAAAEMFMSIIEYDASGVRVHVLEQIDKKAVPLLAKLADILHEVDGDLGLKTQITESLRILFDSGPDGAAGGPVVAQTLAAAAASESGDGGQRKDETERFLNWLYDGEIDHLFAPLKDMPKTHPSLRQRLHKKTGGTEEIRKDSDAGPFVFPPLDAMPAAKAAMLNHLCELLTFVMIHHHFRSQYWVISSEIGACVASLLFAREKHLRLAALRFFRACLAKGNQFINRHFIKIGLLSAILSVIEAESSRDNLVTSACLEFFEHIRKEPIKPLIDHLMDRFEPRVRTLTQHQTIGHYFQAMILQWEKNGESLTAAETDASTASFEAERERRLRDLVRRGENRATIDAEEENYFHDDGDDGEDDVRDAKTAATAAAEAAAATTTASVRASSSFNLPPFNTGRSRSGSGPPAPFIEEEVLGSANTSAPDVNAVADSSGEFTTSGLSKRKKREDEEEEADDMMGRLAKRKSLQASLSNDTSKEGQQSVEEEEAGGESGSSQRATISLSSSSSAEEL